MKIKFIFKDEIVDFCIKPETFVQIKLAKGPKGETGGPGPQGEPGYTPIKGVDYFTEQDKQELLSGVEQDIADLGRDKADKTEIPDVSSFIDKDVNNLTHYTLKTATGSLIDLEINQSTYVVTLSLKDIDGNVISTDTIDLPLESVVIGGTFDKVNKKIVLTLENGNTVDIPVGDLVAGLQTEITSSNKLASDLVDDTNSGNKFTNITEKTAWNAKYDKPSGGIPKTDLASDVQTSLGKADTALQEHQSLADYVKNTDYAKSSKGGTIKTAVNNNFDVTSSGNPACIPLSYSNYTNKDSYAFISKGTLENVITGKELINQTTLDDSQAEQDAKIEELNENNFKFDTATGESLTLTDSARYPFKEFKVGGNTEQQSYTGQQLYNVNELSNTSTRTIDKDGWITLNVDNTAGSSTIYSNMFTAISNLLTPSTNYLIACEIQYFNILPETDDTNTYLCVVDGSGSSQFISAWLLNTKNYKAKQVVTRKTKSSFSSSNNMLRTFAAIKAGMKLEIKFRISVIADTTVTENTFVYQPFVGRNCKS